MNTAGISKYASVKIERSSLPRIIESHARQKPPSMKPRGSFLHPFSQTKHLTLEFQSVNISYIQHRQLQLLNHTHEVYPIQAEFLGCFTISTQACFPSINPLGIAFGVKISYLKTRKHQTSHTSVLENNKTKEVSVHSYAIMSSTVFQKTLHLQTAEYEAAALDRVLSASPQLHPYQRNQKRFWEALCQGIPRYRCIVFGKLATQLQ